MKVRMEPAPGAKMKITLKGGKTVEAAEIQSIEVEPFFSMANGQGEIVRGAVVSDNRGDVDKFVLTASGSNGKLSRRDLADKAVVPLIDRPKSANKKPAGGGQ